MKDYQELHETLKAGDFINVKQEEKNKLYNIFVSHFQYGDFDKANKIIETLVLLEPANPLYLKSKASAEQQLKNYVTAFMFYNYAYILEKDEACLYYMANCAFELGDFAQSKYQLERLIANSNNKKLCAKAKLLVASAEQELKKSQAQNNSANKES